MERNYRSNKSIQIAHIPHPSLHPPPPEKKNKQRGFNIYFMPSGYREIAVKIFFNLTLVPPAKIPIFMFLLYRFIVRVSQPDGNMTSRRLPYISRT